MYSASTPSDALTAQALRALGSLTGIPVVQATTGTAAVILETANVRVILSKAE